MGQGLPSEPGLDLLDPGCHLVDPGVDAGEVRLAAADAPGDHAHLLPRVAVAHHHRAAAVTLQVSDVRNMSQYICKTNPISLKAEIFGK